MPYGESSLEDPEDPNFEPNDEEIHRQWRRQATRLNLFKQQFQEEYLLYLRERHVKDHHPDPIEVPKIEKGDLVLIAKDNVKRSLWDLAEVIEILPSSDGRVRAVRLRTGQHETTRPIVKLYPLLKAKELRPVQDNPGQGQEDATNGQGTAEQQTGSQNDEHDGQNQAPHADPIPPEPTSSRPTRAAKTRGRQRVQQWTRGLRDDD